MAENASLCDHIQFQARLRPNAVAVLGASGPLPYRVLVDDVDALATELLQRDLEGQVLVGLHLGFSYLHLLLILALERLSIPSMSFATADTAPAPPAVLPQYGLTTIISGGVAPADPPCRWITMAEQHRPKLGKPDAARLARIQRPADSLVRIGWSSGTTGGLKGAPITRALQERRLAARRLLHGLDARTRYFTGMPFSPPFGYNLPLAVLSAGGCVILPRPATDFVVLANALRVTLTGATPSMLADMLGKDKSLLHRLETIAAFEVLGAHLPSRLAQDVRFFLTPNIALGFGTTETDRVASADAAVCIADPTAVGFVIPWVDAEIVDPSDRPLPAGREGALRIRSGQTIAGYHRDAEATRRNFRDGWFYSGDVGTIDDRGLLRVTGRTADLIVRDGVTTSPVPLEEAIRALPGVSDVTVFPLVGLDGAQTVGAALVLDAGSDVKSIEAVIATRLGAQAPARLFVVDRLPRGEGGKVLRRELVDLAMRLGHAGTAAP